jgi:hypothetical protein
MYVCMYLHTHTHTHTSYRSSKAFARLVWPLQISKRIIRSRMLGGGPVMYSCMMYVCKYVCIYVCMKRIINEMMPGDKPVRSSLIHEWLSVCVCMHACICMPLHKPCSGISWHVHVCVYWYMRVQSASAYLNSLDLRYQEHPTVSPTNHVLYTRYHEMIRGPRSTQRTRRCRGSFACMCVRIPWEEQARDVIPGVCVFVCMFVCIVTCMCVLDCSEQARDGMPDVCVLVCMFVCIVHMHVCKAPLSRREMWLWTWCACVCMHVWVYIMRSVHACMHIADQLLSTAGQRRVLWCMSFRALVCVCVCVLVCLCFK